jgi:outer membrane receptor protein involved in Fe transport
VLAGTLLGSNVIAQESGGTGAQNEGVIEEIVVTAQKRQQTLLDVGISVSVADSDSIRDRIRVTKASFKPLRE